MRRRLNELVQRRVRDPRVGMISISEVELNVDMRVATVWVTVIGEGDIPDGERVDIVRNAAGFLRTELGRVMRMRHVPELRVVHDDRLAAQSRIEALLGEARRDDAGDGSEAPDDDASAVDAGQERAR